MCAVGSLFAQKGMTTVSYSVGFPISDLHTYISKTSWRGVGLEYQYLVKPNIGVGFSAAWNVFTQAKDYDTYTVKNASLTGKQWRYSNNVPMLVTGSYYFLPEGKVNPYVGLGVGVMYSKRNTDMSLYTISQDSWNFTLQPYAGVLIKGGDYVLMNVSAKYLYGFEQGDIKGNQSYFTLNIGFTFLSQRD
jgi:outer membrane protein